MILPAIGDVVTIVFEFGIAQAVPGRIIAAGKFPVEDLHMLWSAMEMDVGHYCVRERYEGIYWMRGSGPEVDGALLAAYALVGGRGKDSLSGEL